MDSHSQAGIAGSVFILCSTTLGAGILAIPQVFSLIGLWFGVIGLIFFAFVTFYSIYLLLEAGDASQITHGYEDIMEYAFPKFGKLVTTIFILLALIGALSGFLVIIGDELTTALRYLTGSDAFWTHRSVLVPIFVGLVIFPLCLLRDISKLEYTAFVSVFIIFTFVVIVVVLGGKYISRGIVQWDHVKNFDVTVSSVFNALPTVSLAYTCQTSIFPIWKELRNPTKRRMNIIQSIGSSISCVFYVLAGAFGYILRPDETPGNFLGALPNDLFYQILRMFFALAIVFHYPVVHFAFRNSITVMIFGSRPFSWVRHIVVTLCTMIVTTIISLVLPDLGKVFALTGALAAYPIDFLLPALVFIKICIYDGISSATRHDIKSPNPNDVSQVLLHTTIESKHVNYTGGGTKWKKLITPRAIIPGLMIFGSIFSSIISLYVIITGTDWSQFHFGGGD